MSRTNRRIVAAVLLAAGMAGVGAMAGAHFPAADDQEKQTLEALQEAEAQLRAAEAKLKLAQADSSGRKGPSSPSSKPPCGSGSSPWSGP